MESEPGGRVESAAPRSYERGRRARRHVHTGHAFVAAEGHVESVIRPEHQVHGYRHAKRSQIDNRTDPRAALSVILENAVGVLAHYEQVSIGTERDSDGLIEPSAARGYEVPQKGTGLAVVFADRVGFVVCNVQIRTSAKTERQKPRLPDPVANVPRAAPVMPS